ncbi:MAG: hybrid sensor histidine kinase/response regulator [Chitinophagaceae bacterium]|nr:MAG: hybrid sensor histidine kinase/response regulator [Chitinophagaceae bacterium]
MMPTMPLRPTAFLAFAFLWTIQDLQAQQLPRFENISTAQGLSQGMIFGMIQDREGFIWIATKEGLNRYDGYGFRVFTNDPADPWSLSSNYIRTVFEDSKGRIWAATQDAGLNIYDKKTGRFHRIQHQEGNKNSLAGNRLSSPVVELPDGRFILSPENKGLDIISLPDNYFTGNTTATIAHHHLPQADQPSGIGKDEKGNIWVGTESRRVWLFDPASGKSELLNDGNIFTQAFNRVGRRIWTSRDLFPRNRMIQDSTNIFRPFDTLNNIIPGIIIKERDGSISFPDIGKPPTGQSLALFHDFSDCAPGKPFSLARNTIFMSTLINLQMLMVDRSGIVWAGTAGLGFNKLNLSASRFNHQQNGLSTRNIISLGNNTFFLGGWRSEKWINGAGTDVANPNPDIPVTDNCNNFIVDNKGDYWIWKDQPENILLHYNSASQQSGSRPLALKGSEDKQPMTYDRKGYLWICGLNGSIARMDPKTQNIAYFTINKNRSQPMLQSAQTTAFYEDNKGIKWIGTEEGFVRFEITTADTALVRWYKHGGEASLNYNYVSCFLDDPDDDSYLWVCTKGGGLNRLDKRTGKFTHLTTKNGLPNDVVYGILADKTGNIWGSTNRGIFCLVKKKDASGEWTFRNYTTSDGLQGDEFNTGAFAKLPDGRLLFGGVNGINIFDPAEILTPGYQPDVFITSLLLGNKPVLAGDNTGVLHETIETTPAITLNHNQDIVTLEFSSLDFTAPVQNKYRYKMEGIDDSWVESGNRRTATYLHLPAGNYTFKVQASNSQGEWSTHIAELRIRILPPWWLTWWAYSAYVLLGIAAIGAWVRFSVNRARLKSQLSFEQLEAKRVRELDTVKTQLYTNITHEFRTPLTVIMGMAEQVVRNPEERFHQRMDMIKRNGQSLLNLVNEMLDLSKLETGKMQLNIIGGEILHYLRYITEPFVTLGSTHQKEVRFTSDIDTLYVNYDPEKIRQILSNLLSNALKFTSAGGIIGVHISKNEIPHDEPNLTLIIQVRDNGIGIPADQLQQVFERFFQLDNSHTRKVEGTGIGLALTRELVKLMEGEIIVKSPAKDLATGTEFTVILPLTRVAEGTEAPLYQDSQLVHDQLFAAAEYPSGNAGQNDLALILIVEDNPDVVAYTSSCLTDYRVAVARNGQEGFEKARELVPDLIITDVMMPLLDGFGLSRQLRANEFTSHIPIIMLTAKADAGSRLEGISEGADVYLEKPFNPDELLLRIRKLLELRALLRKHYLDKAGIVPDVIQSIPSPPNLLANEQVTEDNFVTRVREAVEKNIDQADFTVEHLCRLVFMSHSQLHRKLDALTGLSPNKFIRLVRLKKSKELLRSASLSISSIAIDCGYNDPGYFARVFKQEFGCTPQEWRAAQVTAAN